MLSEIECGPMGHRRQMRPRPKGAGKARDLADLELIIPSNETARIQECHIFLGHVIFENVEKKMYGV